MLFSVLLINTIVRTNRSRSSLHPEVLLAKFSRETGGGGAAKYPCV